MSQSSRFPAVIAYLLPVVGWLYVFLFQRQNPFALYHLRQAVGLCLFLLMALIGWAVIAWLLAWIPLLVTVSMALFTLVILAYIYGFFVWLSGILNALNNRLVPLPGVGRWADHLPIQ